MIAQFRYARHRYAPPTKHSTVSAVKMKKSNLAHPQEKPEPVPKPKTAARKARLRNAAASLSMVGFSFEQVILGSAKKLSQMPNFPGRRFKAALGDRHGGVLK